MTALFRYTAREASGRTLSGHVEAQSRAEALARLHRRKLTPVSLAPAEARQADTGRLSDRGARDLSRALAQLLDSGLSFAQALRFASDELQGEAAATAMRLREATERGEPASSALGQLGGSSARLLGGVIQAGEASGHLAQALHVAAAAFARSTALRARVLTGMIYPAFVVISTLATLTAFMFFVVPTLASAFEGAEAHLPQSTRDLLALSAWLKANGLLVAGVAGGLIAVVASSQTIRGLILTAMDWSLSSPAGLGIAPRLDYSAFAELAALSLGAGVPGAAAFEAASAGVRSARLRARLARFVTAIRVGERASEALQRTAAPPRAMVRLMQVGEETGDLAAAMRQAAILLAGEAEERMERLGAVAGPIVTMTLGGLVASVVVSLFLGLLSLSDLAVN